MGERKYFLKTNRLDDSQRKLVEENLRLVTQLAKKYSQSAEMTNDLIQEGNLGLMEAAKRYDDSGGEFSTFAWPYIEGYMLKQLCVDRTVKIPENHYWLIKKVHKFREARLNIKGSYPDSDEIAREFSSGSRAYSAKEIEGMLTGSEFVESLDAPLYDDGEGSMHDVIGEDANHEEASHNGRLREILEKYLDRLAERLPEKHKDITMHIITEHYWNNKDFPEIAEDKGVTMATVKQRHFVAMRMLKAIIPDSMKKELLGCD